MFKITNIDSENVIIEAIGKITKEDYTQILEPFLDKIKNEEREVNLLFHTAKDFDGYTIGAGWEDFKFGIHYFHTIKKCAIVSDVFWIRSSCHFFAPVVPFSTKIFHEKDFEEAKTWLVSSRNNLTCNLDQKNSLATVEIKDSLAAEDFKILSQTVDPWIKNSGELKGLIIHVKKFPLWENIFGFTSHFSFIKNHHKKIKKLAIVADGALPNVMPKLAGHFIKAEIKNFNYDQLEEAKNWILG